MLIRTLVGAGLVIACLWPAPTNAAPCRLHKVAEVADANIIVYFTRFKREDQTDGRYRKCRVVSQCRQDCTRFFVTRFRQDATVVVHRSNWP